MRKFLEVLAEVIEALSTLICWVLSFFFIWFFWGKTFFLWAILLGFAAGWIGGTLITLSFFGLPFVWVAWCGLIARLARWLGEL